MNNNGITIITPAYGDITRLVNSIANQYRGENEDWKVEFIIANDNIEAENYETYYNDKVAQLSKYDYITTKVLNHKDEGHWYQGKGRVRGIEEAAYDYVLTIDCDDEYAPYALTQLMGIIKKETSNEKQDKTNSGKTLAFIGFDFLSYDSFPYINHIGRDNPTIWVQSRCYYKPFIIEHRLNKLYDETCVSSKRGEDYPFINLFDYYLQHETDKYYSVLMGHDAPPMAYWTPNHNSFSRRDPYYGQGLAGYTMGSSIAIYEQMKKYNKEHNIEEKEDEFLKHRILNMALYSFFNLYDFIWTVGETKNCPVNEKDPRKPYIPKEHHWTLLRDNCKTIRKLLLEYWGEIQDNDVVNEYWAIINRSDCRKHNTFEGTFFDYMNKGCRWFKYDFNEFMMEARKLDFDSINCLQSKQVKAWKARHNK